MGIDACGGNSSKETSAVLIGNYLDFNTSKKDHTVTVNLNQYPTASAQLLKQDTLNRRHA